MTDEMIVIRKYLRHMPGERIPVPDPRRREQLAQMKIAKEIETETLLEVEMIPDWTLLIKAVQLVAVSKLDPILEAIDDVQALIKWAAEEKRETAIEKIQARIDALSGTLDIIAEEEVEPTAVVEA